MNNNTRGDIYYLCYYDYNFVQHPIRLDEATLTVLDGLENGDFFHIEGLGVFRYIYTDYDRYIRYLRCSKRG
jgi:hypothetical protein